MKTNYVNYIKPFLVILIFVLLWSCKKDDPDPDYVGTWVAIETVAIDEVTSVQVKDVLVFEKSKFDQVQQVKNTITNNWVSLLGMRGTFTVEADKMNITITEAGQSSVSTITQLPTGEIEYLKATDINFASFMAFIEIPATFVSEYSVSGNEITLKTDLNNDSDYNDLGEVRIYTRQ